MIRVLIADDHAIVRSGLKQIFALVPDLQVVGEAASGPEVLELLGGALELDLLLLDLNMGGMIAADLIQRIHARREKLPILVLSMHNEAQVATRMLKSGANGYVTKDCDTEVLLGAIRKIAAGGKFIAQALAETMVFDGTQAHDRPLHHLLSSREAEVMHMLTDGLGVNEIAKRLGISGKTVSTHKIRLMEKMRVSTLADLMRYAMEHGLLA